MNNQELFTEYSNRKRIHPDHLENFCSRLKALGKSIATLNGSFDLLHAGHLQIIYEASLVADCLIVALNTDRSIQEYKSPNRPIIPLEYRLQMMSALAFVDYVTWFDEINPIPFLQKVKPNVHVNGADWGSECIEKETVLSLNGTLHIAQFVPGLSTSSIIKKIKDLCD